MLDIRSAEADHDTVLEVPVEDLMAVGAGDEIGTPDEHIEQCSCGVLFRVGGSHRCGHVGEWVSWDRYQARQEARQ